MPVQVLYFAGIVDITQINKERVLIKNETTYTIEDVIKTLIEKYGDKFEKILETCMFAVNMEYVPTSHILQEGDELAIIPPVSGG
ncbi:molybdopterin converting factor, subunit 1 [Cunninghamella echinulata]|nr:molybdopterin converting factor, subunit 1 [Cunninghamella echinulata]